MSTAIAKIGGGWAIAPANMGELFQFAKMLAESDLVPKDYSGKPGNCMVAIQMGGELGLSPMQALQNISVINGRPSLWGDAMLAVCQAHPTWRGKQETFDGTTAKCVVRRLIMATGSIEETVSEFSVEDAKKAKLWEKAGPWQQYTKRMLKMRARGFALRDAFSDVLRGIISTEEAQDMPTEVRAEVMSSKPITPEPLRKIDGEPDATPKQERKSEPPPAATVPSFSRKFPDKKWAGKPLAGAGGEILSDYAAWVESLQKDPKATDDMRRIYQRALDDTAAALDAILAGESADPGRHVRPAGSFSEPDPIIEGLEAEVAKRDAAVDGQGELAEGWR